MGMRQTVAGHVNVRGRDHTNPQIDELTPSAWSTDGNSVDSEREAVRLASNSMMYNAVTQGLGRRMAMLRYAASDGRG